MWHDCRFEQSINLKSGWKKTYMCNRKVCEAKIHNVFSVAFQNIATHIHREAINIPKLNRKCYWKLYLCGSQCLLFAHKLTSAFLLGSPFRLLVFSRFLRFICCWLHIMYLLDVFRREYFSSKFSALICVLFGVQQNDKNFVNSQSSTSKTENASPPKKARTQTQRATTT